MIHIRRLFGFLILFGFSNVAIADGAAKSSSHLQIENRLVVCLDRQLVDYRLMNRIITATSRDNGAAASQQTGSGTMKMDHSHRFISTAAGGRIVMQRYTGGARDSAAVARLRQHLKEIARLFTGGDFRLPPGVESLQEVPGTRLMAAKGTAISYTARPLPRGAEVVISSTDAEAIEAIHAFLRFHAVEHQALESGRR